MTQYRSNRGPKTVAWRRTIIARFVAGIGTIMLLMLAVLPASAQAATFTPTTFADVAVSSLGAVNASGQITDQGNAITLRSAVIAANALGATNTIILGAGTYILSIPGTGETASAGNALIGDLDVLAPASGTVTLTVQGAGASVTTIQQTSGIDRIFDLHPINLAGSINFTLTGVTVKGGNITAASGGAMLTGRPGDVTNLTNCVFDGNISPNNGGAISQSSGNAMHNLTITNCVFSNNSAGATGGAVQYAGQGIVTITGSTFVNNTAGTDGGALNLTGAAPGGTHNISTSNFSNNTANGTVGGGGAIGGVQGQALNAHFNRFVGNLAPLVPTGKVVSIGGGTFTGIDLNTNWWGVNTGPAATDLAAAVTVPTVWLQLKLSASPASVAAGATSTLTADFLSDSANNVIAPGNLAALVGRPITFGGGAFGSTSGAQATIQTAGTATATFIGGGSVGVSTTSALVDSATATANVNIRPSVTVNTANLLTTATSMTINGFGFSTTPGNNLVSFSGGATGTVTAATSTQLTVTSLAGLSAGTLNASVTTSGVSSGAAVQVATVVGQTQTITFPQPADTTINAGPVILTATASSLLTVSYTSNSTSICTVSGASVTLVTVGGCSISANQSGNANFAAASPVTRTFNINNPLPTLTSISPTSATAGGGAFNLTLTGTNFINASFVRFNGTAIATVFSSSTQLTATVPANLITTFGTFLVIASNPLPGGGDSASRNFNVTQSAQTITFPQPADTAVNAGPVNLTATASSLLTVSYTSNSTSICTVTGASVTLLTVGVCSITANQVGNATYSPAPAITKTFNLTLATQAAFTAIATPSSVAIGSTSALSTAGGSGSGAISFTSNNANCTILGNTLTAALVGGCTVTATKAADANFNAATATVSVTTTLASQAALNVIATPNSIALGATSALSTTGGSGSGAISFTSNNANCTIVGSTLTAAAVGGCTVTATKAADSNFNSTTATVAVTTTPATQTVTFTPASPVSVGVAPITLTATASSGLTTFTFSTSSASTICTVAGNQLTIVGSGTCALIATQGGNANFASASANADVIVEVLFTAVQSRKTHGAAGDFDIAIDTTLIAPNITVEPRTIGAGHSIVFQFNGAVSAAGTVSVAPVGNAMAVAVGNDVVVTLTSVSDNQRVTVTLINVNGSVNPPPAAIGFMVGDINNTRSVNSSDISGVKARSGQATTALNFRFDVNATGAINSSDISAVKARSGLTLP